MDNDIGIEGFETARLLVKNWHEKLRDDGERKALVAELIRILTPAVLQDLPPSMQVEPTETAINRWVSERAAESTGLLVFSERGTKIAGLLFLVHVTSDGPESDIHVGYLLAESEWGKGYATELLTGLINSFRSRPAVRLIGGVGKRNIASANVLLKAGFSRNEALSDPETDQFEYFTRGN